MCGYHSGVPWSFSLPFVQCQRRLRRRPRRTNTVRRHHLAMSSRTITHSPGPYTWNGVSANGSAYTPAPDAKANANGHTGSHSPFVAVLLPHRPRIPHAPVCLCSHRPTRPKRGNISAVRKQATIGLGGFISRNGGFRTSSHSRPALAPAPWVQRQHC